MVLPLITDAALLLLFGIAAASSLRIRSLCAFMLAMFVLIWGDLVLSVEVASAVWRVYPGALLSIHALFAAGALAAWVRAGRPGFPEGPLPTTRGIWRSVRGEPDLWLLGVCTLGAYLMGAYLVIAVPPNNADSLAYHLSRVAYWIQHESLRPWATHDFRQTVFPVNAEIGALWGMLFLRSDVLAGFVQWTGGLACAAAIFGTARRCGAGPRESLFATLLWATLPQVLLQSTTTQNDLLTSAFILTAVFLLLDGLKEGHRGTLVLSGCALGLAVGTKLTALLVLPGLAVGVALLWLVRRPRPSRVVALWVLACLGGFLLFGASNYIRCTLLFGHPLGPREFRESSSRPSEGLDISLAKANAARYLYQATEPSGLPLFLILSENKKEIVGNIEAWRTESAERLFEALGVDPNDPATTQLDTEFAFDSPFPFHEDLIWFGPLGFLVWLPVVVYWGVACFFRRDPARLLLVLTCFGFVFLTCAELVWDPWRGRFFTLAASLSAALVANLFRRGRAFVLLRWVIVLLAVSVLVKALVRNESKPLVGPNAIWGKERDALRYVNLPYHGKALRTVEQWLPPDATVGFLTQPGDSDYILFGSRLTRTVLPLIHWPEAFPTEWFDSHEQVTHFVIHRADSACVARLAPSDYQKIIGLKEGWSVIVRTQRVTGETPAPDSALDSPSDGT